jgi:hypothetical protein
MILVKSHLQSFIFSSEILKSVLNLSYHIISYRFRNLQLAQGIHSLSFSLIWLLPLWLPLKYFLRCPKLLASTYYQACDEVHCLPCLTIFLFCTFPFLPSHIHLLTFSFLATLLVGLIIGFDPFFYHFIDLYRHQSYLLVRI